VCVSLSVCVCVSISRYKLLVCVCVYVCECVCFIAYLCMLVFKKYVCQCLRVCGYVNIFTENFETDQIKRLSQFPGTIKKGLNHNFESVFHIQILSICQNRTLPKNKTKNK